MLLNELHRSLGVLRGELRLIGVRRDRSFTVDQREVRELRRRMLRPHVIRVRQTQIIVEAVASRQELGVMPEVPFAIDRGRVPARLEYLGDRHFVGVNAVSRRRSQCSVNSHSVRIAPGQQRSPRRRADGLSDIETGEPPPLGSHPIQIRRVLMRRTKTVQVRVTEVIRKDHNKGRRPLGRQTARHTQQLHQPDASPTNHHAKHAALSFMTVTGGQTFGSSTRSVTPCTNRVMRER